MLHILHIAVMALTFLYMFNRAQLSETRMVALVPLGMILVDSMILGSDFLAVPFLAVLLTAARLTVLGCCGAALRREKQVLKTRQRRRMRMRLEMSTAALPRITPTLQENVHYA
jgi:hypothetical protein